MPFFTKTTPAPAPPPESDEEARRRLEQEALKIQQEISSKRKEKMKSLVGDQAESIGQRREEVRHALDEWNHKGTEHLGQAEVPEEVFASPVSERKVLLHKAQAISAHKGQVEGHQHVAEDLQNSFQSVGGDSANVPSLFHYDPCSPRKSPPTPSKKTVASTADAAQTQAAMEKIRPKGWDGTTYHSLVDLRQRRVTGIDMKNREQYLAPAEFEKVFGMTKEVFAVQPKWKREKLKQGLHLF